jgi:D-inositol-3-phosphate glycosyltransferase
VPQYGISVKITLISGDEPHYQLGLLSGLIDKNLMIDVIGGESLQGAAVLREPGVKFLKLRPVLSSVDPLWVKLIRVISYYCKLATYAARTESSLFHIQWPYKFLTFERTLLNLYYKALAKKLVYTAHNVDRQARDRIGRSSWFNRFTLRFLYRTMDHIIVHTHHMKSDLVRNFGIPGTKISVVPHGINSAIPETAMGKAEARRNLGIDADRPVLLFFGLIDRYKGLECLVKALAGLRLKLGKPLLIVAGNVKDCEDYWGEIQTLIEREGLENCIKTDLRYIPDDMIEVFFKAADALVLPYRSIFQSGVMFVAYRFGLPVIATDVGSFKDEIIEGKTGYTCIAGDSAALEQAIQRYFSSDLFKDLERRRKEIINYANEKYSWTGIGRMTRDVYLKLSEP